MKVSKFNLVIPIPKSKFFLWKNRIVQGIIITIKINKKKLIK